MRMGNLMPELTLTPLIAGFNSHKGLRLWQSWASSSGLMLPASALRHPVSQSGTGAFRYQTGSPYSGTGLVPASVFLIIPVPD
jgi:hypothetical protein